MQKLSIIFCSLAFICFQSHIHACDATFTYSIIQNVISFTSSNVSNKETSQWNFGDGSFSSEINASHAYTQSGTYTVIHTVSDSSGSCSDTKTQVITLNFTPSCSVTFDYSYQMNISDSVKGDYSPHYYFIAHPKLIGGYVTDYNWTIDGTSVSSYNYLDTAFNAPGIHTICVQIQTDGGCTSQSCQQLQVFGTCNLNASFSYSIPDQANPKAVQLQASPQLQHGSYKWIIQNSYDYPDTGYTFLAHFSEPGTFPVHLTVIDTSSYCEQTVGQNINVGGSPCDTFKTWVTYTLNPSNDKEFYFLLNSNLPVQSQIWTMCSEYSNNCYDTFNISNPDFIFPSGINEYSFILCVDATTTEGCKTNFCEYLPVGDSICDNSILSYTYKKGSSNTEAIFTATSNNPITSQTWVIHALSTGDSVVLSGNNPTYTFPNADTYNVCLEAVLSNGCAKTHCDTIIVPDSINTHKIISYPNPATNKIVFNLQLTNTSTISINIYNVNGINVYSSQMQGAAGTNTITIPVQSLAKGQYFIDINDNQQRSSSIFQKM